MPSGLTFEPNDVAFLFIPEGLHVAARTFFEDHLAEHTGPAYLCPYVDPNWDMTLIQAAFADVASPPLVGPPAPSADGDNPLGPPS